MSNLIYSINATLPIFLLIILGKVLKTTKIINDEFTKTADRYVFRIALPALLFSDLTENNVGSSFDGKYVLFCFSVTIFSIAVLWGLTEKFMKNEEQKGAFIQGSYRSSAAILGLAFINNMYDSVGMAPLMIIGCVPLYNIFAVIILTLKGDNGGKKPNMKETFINVMKNPILLSILIALPFALLNLHFPSFVNKAIGSVANTATPLALISIGASFEGKKACFFYQTDSACRSVFTACRLLWLPQSGTHGTACYAWLTDYGFQLHYGKKHRKRWHIDIQHHCPDDTFVLTDSDALDFCFKEFRSPVNYCRFASPFSSKYSTRTCPSDIITRHMYRESFKE